MKHLSGRLHRQPKHRIAVHTRLIVYCDMAMIFGAVGGWAADNLITPIVTGLVVGLVLRWVAVLSEASQHDLRVEEIETDLTRWVKDRDRELTGEINIAAALAKTGVIEDAVQIPPPAHLKEVQPGDMSSSGGFERRAERIMRQALQEYRDEASRKVSAYRTMARAEGYLHRLARWWRREGSPDPLRLSAADRAALATWRRRTLPTYGGPVVEVENDPTKADNAKEIWPLEEEGLGWNEAGRRKRRKARRSSLDDVASSV